MTSSKKKSSPGHQMNENRGLRRRDLLQKGPVDGVSPRVKWAYMRAFNIVSREISRIKLLAMGDKLESKTARDLIEYVKLLGEMKKQQREFHEAKLAIERKRLEEMPDEEFKNRIKKFLAEGK